MFLKLIDNSLKPCPALFSGNYANPYSAIPGPILVGFTQEHIISSC